MSAESTPFGREIGVVVPSISADPASCFLRWRDSWAVGIEPIDAGHRMLCALLGQIAQEFCGNQADPVALGGGCRPEAGIAADRVAAKASLLLHLRVLGEHVRAHFEREEALMRVNDYPDLAAHRREHRLMLAEYVDMLRGIDAEDGEVLDLATLRALKVWLLGHLLDADRKLADYLHGLERITRH